MLYWENVSPTHSYVPVRIAHTQFVVVVLMSYRVERGDDLMMVSSNRLIGVYGSRLIDGPLSLFFVDVDTRVVYLSLFLVVYYVDGLPVTSLDPFVKWSCNSSVDDYDNVNVYESCKES